MAASSLQMTRREDGSYLFDFVNHSQQVLFTLNECRQFANLCDCSVVVEGQVFYAHKGVLVSCSDYFKEIFTSQAVSARQSIDLVNIKVPGFQLFIDFAYMARMAMTMQDVDMVLNTAVGLKSGTMLEACCEFLKSQLTGDNCVDIISIAEAYNLTEIKRQANRLMCERLIELSQTYKKGMPDTKEDLEALTARFAAQTSQAAQLPILSAVSAQLPAALIQQHQSSSQQQQNLVAAQAQAILEAATSKLEAAAAKLDVNNAVAAVAKLEEEESAVMSSGTEDDDDPGGMETDSSEEDASIEEKPLLVAQLPMDPTIPNKPVLRRLQSRTNRLGLQSAGEQRLKIATKAALKSPIVTRSRGRQAVRPRRNLRIQRALRIKKGAIAHSKMKKDYFCKICELPFAKLRDLRTHTSDQHHKCTKCNKYFMHSHELDSHQVMHTTRHLQKGPKRYQCHFCGKHCGYSSALKIHIRTHTGEKPYKCDLCDQKFIQSINLKRHVLTNHSKETPYQCKFCGKKFSVFVYLKSHEITHSDHRPFQCEACGAMFKRKSDLRSHNRVHSTEKPYSCELCHAKFKSPNDLKTHTLIHNDRKPHTCDKCGACFKRTGHLNRHMMIHTNAKPFQCETCGAQFNRKENLRSHQRIHSGEQPYKCGVCGASFRHLSSLKMHEKNHWSDHPTQDSSISTHDPTPTTLQHIAALMGLGGLGGNPQQTAPGLTATSMSASGTVSTPQLNVSTPAQLMTQVMSSQQLQRDMIQVPVQTVQVKIYPSGDQMPSSPQQTGDSTVEGRGHMTSPSPQQQQQSHMTSALMGLQGLANQTALPVAVTLGAADTHSPHMTSPTPAHMASALMGLQGLTGQQQQQQSIPVSVTLAATGTPPPHTSAPVMTPHEQIIQRDQIPLHPLQVKVYPNPDANAIPTSTQAMSLSQRTHMTSPSPGTQMTSGLVQHGIHLGLPQNLQVHVQSASQGITTTQAALQDHTVYMSM